MLLGQRHDNMFHPRPAAGDLDAIHAAGRKIGPPRKTLGPAITVAFTATHGDALAALRGHEAASSAHPMKYPVYNASSTAFSVGSGELLFVAANGQRHEPVPETAIQVQGAFTSLTNISEETYQALKLIGLAITNPADRGADGRVTTPGTYKGAAALVMGSHHTHNHGTAPVHPGDLVQWGPPIVRPDPVAQGYFIMNTAAPQVDPRKILPSTSPVSPMDVLTGVRDLVLRAGGVDGLNRDPEEGTPKHRAVQKLRNQFCLQPHNTWTARDAEFVFMNVPDGAFGRLLGAPADQIGDRLRDGRAFDDEQRQRLARAVGCAQDDASIRQRILEQDAWLINSLENWEAHLRRFRVPDNANARHAHNVRNHVLWLLSRTARVFQDYYRESFGRTFFKSLVNAAPNDTIYGALLGGLPYSNASL